MTNPEWLSVGVSVTTALMTSYFWLVANREKRPRLGARWRGVRDTYVQDEVFDEPEATPTVPAVKYVAVVAQFWVSNMSIRPNAVLGVRVQVRATDGKWIGGPECPRGKTYARPAAMELPLTLPPRDMAEVAAYVYIPVTPETLERYRESDGYWDAFAATVASPVAFKVEVRGLNGRTFVSHVVVPDAKR